MKNINTLYFKLTNLSGLLEKELLTSFPKAKFNRILSSDRNFILADTKRGKKYRECRLIFLNNNLSITREIKFKNSLPHISVSKETGFVAVRCYDRNLYLFDCEGNSILTLPLKPFGVGATKYTRGNFRSLCFSDNGKYLIFSVEDKYIVFDIKNRCVLGTGNTHVNFSNLSNNIARVIHHFGDWIYASAIASNGTILFGTYSGRLLLIRNNSEFIRGHSKSITSISMDNFKGDSIPSLEFPKQDIQIGGTNEFIKMSTPIYKIYLDEKNDMGLVYLGTMAYSIGYDDNKLRIIAGFGKKEISNCAYDVNSCILMNPELYIFFKRGKLYQFKEGKVSMIEIPKTIVDLTFQKSSGRLLLLKKEGLYSLNSRM